MKSVVFYCCINKTFKRDTNQGFPDLAVNVYQLQCDSQPMSKNTSTDSEDICKMFVHKSLPAFTLVCVMVH